MILYILRYLLFIAFSGLTLFGCQEERLSCKKLIETGAGVVHVPVWTELQMTYIWSSCGHFHPTGFPRLLEVLDFCKISNYQ